MPDKKLYFVVKERNTRVTSLEQLSLAEFSGEYAGPKVYEKDHKSVLGIWIKWDLKVKIWVLF